MQRHLHVLSFTVSPSAFPSSFTFTLLSPSSFLSHLTVFKKKKDVEKRTVYLHQCFQNLMEGTNFAKVPAMKQINLLYNINMLRKLTFLSMYFFPHPFRLISTNICCGALYFNFFSLILSDSLQRWSNSWVVCRAWLLGTSHPTETKKHFYG